jgi:large subunit ribosomal protein L23
VPDLKYYDIILKPVITEKTLSFSSGKKYFFYVNRDANKCQIKEAIEKIFSVKVCKINVMNYVGKKKVRGRIVGKSADKKKAVVKLTVDSKEIELFNTN